MTDPSVGATAPPKKRSFFKKAAWQTAPKTEEGKEHDMFSHSNTFRDIVAEETNRKTEEKKRTEEAQKRKAEEARKRKVEEERERKRRKVSIEPDDEKLSGSGSRSSPRRRRLGSQPRSQTPLSPVRLDPPTDTLSTRYDSLTKSSSSTSFLKNDSNIIDLGDSDDEYSPLHKESPSPEQHRIPIHSAKPAPSDDLEEVEDPTLAALKAKARARAAARNAKTSQAAAPTATSDKAKSAVVQLLITSMIPETNPLLIKIKTDTSIDKPREAWCKRQGFSPEKTANIFMTFKKRRVFDSTKVERLGLHIDDNGCVTVDGDPTIYDEVNVPKVHLEAWTEETLRQWKKEEAAEAEAKKKAAEPPPVVEEPEPEPEPEPEVKTIRLILKAKGREEFKIRVNPDTNFGHLASVYKQNRGIPEDQPITLMFDGDRLRTLDTVADADIDDMDSIEVHFK